MLFYSSFFCVGAGTLVCHIAITRSMGVSIETHCCAHPDLNLGSVGCKAVSYHPTSRALATSGAHAVVVLAAFEPRGGPFHLHVGLNHITFVVTNRLESCLRLRVRCIGARDDGRRLCARYFMLCCVMLCCVVL